MEKKGALYTPAKLAQAVGAPEGRIKKLIEHLGIEPDEVQGRCKYYGPEALAKIRKELQKKG